MTYEHQVELTSVGEDASQALLDLCAMLDAKSAEGFECITVFPLQLTRTTMKNGLLVSGPSTPGIAALLRRAKDDEPQTSGE